jgi:hypothetical protein
MPLTRDSLGRARLQWPGRALEAGVFCIRKQFIARMGLRFPVRALLFWPQTVGCQDVVNNAGPIVAY